MKKILVTGGCGFIGHHFVQHIFKNTDWEIVIIDKLTYASKGLDRLNETKILESKRVKFFCYDLNNDISVGLVIEIGDIDYIVHMAAETHVDNSIKMPELFINNNVVSTVKMIEYASKLPT